MRALVQRVLQASVTVDEVTVGQISAGLLVFLGVGRRDTELNAKTLAEKVVLLRVFCDEHGKMNRCVTDVSGDILVVPQFTLYADTRRGNRPSYSEAATPELAKPLYETFIRTCRNKPLTVATGVFQAHMQVFGKRWPSYAHVLFRRITRYLYETELDICYSVDIWQRHPQHSLVQRF